MNRFRTGFLEPLQGNPLNRCGVRRSRTGSAARRGRRFLNTWTANRGGMGSAYVAVMSEINSYRDLVCWQKAMDLALLVYELTGKYPRDERFGLTAHTRKSAVSVPSNIAEGTRHRTPGYISRLTIGLGEHAELETQMIIADR